jgi:hypothetical protein
MGAPTNAANVKKALANSEPSTHEGRADMTFARRALVCISNFDRDERLASNVRC